MKKILLFAMVMGLLCFSSLQHVSAIGMMTQPIIIKDILRGQEMLVTLNLLNSENKEVIYGLKAEGQVAPWVKFYTVEDKDTKNPITEIKVPAGKFLDVKAKFSIPSDTPNSKYTGSILVFLTTSGQIKSEDTSANVSQQVSRNVTITVSDKEIIQLKTAFIPASYEVAEGKALSVRVLYDNQGNVALKPELHVKITKEEATAYNVIFPYPDNQEAVRAYSQKEIPAIEWQTNGQAMGEYGAEIKVFLGGKEVQSETFSFSIGKASPDFLAALSLFKGANQALIWFFTGAILVIGGGIFWTLYKKRRV